MSPCCMDPIIATAARPNVRTFGTRRVARSVTAAIAHAITKITVKNMSAIRRLVLGGVQLAAHAGEQTLDAGAERRHGDDRGDRDECNDQGVLDEGRAFVVAEHRTQSGEHGWIPFGLVWFLVGAAVASTSQWRASNR